MKAGKWKMGVPLCLLVFALMLLGGCGGGSDNPAPQAGALEKWAGSWKSLARFVADPIMTPVYAKIHEGISQDYTAKGVKDYFVQMFWTDFDGMRISGDSVTFLNGSDVLGSARYQAQGDGKTAMQEEFSLFQVIEGSASKPEGSKFDLNSVKFLALPKSGPVTQFEGGILRVPVRYSGESLKEMMQGRPTWMATFGKEGTTAEDVRKELDHNVKNFISFLSTMLRPFTEWQGTWINAVSYVDKPEMNSVYEAVAKKASEMGKSYTPEAVKAFVKKMQASDFVGGMKLQGSQAVFLNEKGGVKETVAYVYDGVEQRAFSDKIPVPMLWTVFKSEAAGAYKYLVLLPAGKDTEDGFTHFHMRYGDKSVGDLVDNKSLTLWFPTLCEEGTTAAKFASDMQAGAEELVMMMEMDKVAP